MGAIRQRCGRRKQRICIWAVAGREAVQHVDGDAGWRLGRCIVAAEGMGWSSREAAGGCRGEEVLWYIQCAQWTVMLTLMLGGDLDVATWV